VSIKFLARIAVSFFPVLLYLFLLVYVDGYKLVRARTIVVAMLWGGVAAVLSLGLNTALSRVMNLSPAAFARYVAPVVEETLKGAFVIQIVRLRRVGFIVDAAIVGFAVGTGFGIVENYHYLSALGHASAFLFVARGFGTAIMHGGTTSILAISFKERFDVSRGSGLAPAVPGVLLAILLHSFYNHFVAYPVLLMGLIYVTLPLVMVVTFRRGNRTAREWLRAGFDTDAELLDVIRTGRVAAGRIGRLIENVGKSLPPEVVVDALCYVRLHVELAISAKGLLLMRQAGFEPKVPPGTRAKLEELDYLEKSIGKSTRLAVLPALHNSKRDLWQLHLLAGLDASR
jgi:RsiW-degrading membrane proteinase PrsW (M82 family)